MRAAPYLTQEQQALRTTQRSQYWVSPGINLVHLECMYILNNVLLTNVCTLVGPEIKQRTYFT